MLGNRERILTPDADTHVFADACFALSSGTRLSVLQALLLADGPLHIREVARRVGLDPSPVRTHLDLLVKTGLAEEIPDATRERRFIPNVSGVRLILTPPERPADVPRDLEATKQIRKTTEKIRALEEKVHKLERELAALAEERAFLWKEAASPP